VSAQLIKAGDELLVVLPLAEYRQLQNAVAQAKDVLKEPLPAASLDDAAPSNPEETSPLRTWRKHRQLSARELSSLVSISPNYLSELENNNRIGPVTLWKKLAEALHTDIESILPPDEAISE
jgi:DNA-binding XRE family transcriptional regulator